MGRWNLSQNSFIKGELGPKLQGRTDLEAYDQGCEKLENMIPFRQGGATKRMGTRFLTSLSDGGATPYVKGTLIPFIFSKDDAGIVILDPEQPLAADKIRFMHETRGFGTITATGSDPSDVLTPGLDPNGFHYAQSGDILIITHSSGIKPIILKRTLVLPPDIFVKTHTDTLFAFGTPPLTPTSDSKILLQTPYRDRNIDGDLILGVTAVAAGIVDLDSQDAGATPRAFFDAGHVGAFFKIRSGASEAVYQVTSFTSSTVVRARELITGPTGITSDDWAESSWSNYRGWPRAVTIFESRLVFGGNTAEPDTVWASNLNNLGLFMQSPLVQDASTDASGLNYFGSLTEDNPFSYTLGSNQVNSIQWLGSKRALAIGTLGGEYTATGGNEAVLSTEIVLFKQQTSSGSSPRMPIGVNQSLIYTSRDGKRVNDFLFNTQLDAYQSLDLNVINDDIINHNFGGGVSESYQDVEFGHGAFQNSRSTVWYVTTKKELISYTLQKNAGVEGWARHTIGGQDVKVLSVASIPNTSGTFDDLWLLVERTINSSTVVLLEKMGANFEHPRLDNTSTDDDDYPWFSDSAVRVVTAPATVFAGFTHLEGETVKVLADGFVHPDVVVSGGNITLNSQASQVIAGLEYRPILVTMPVQKAANFGDAVGGKKRIDRTVVKFYKTYGANVGPREDLKEKVVFKPPNVVMGDPLIMFTGEKVITFRISTERLLKVVVDQDEPLPLSVLSITPRGVTND